MKTALACALALVLSAPMTLQAQEIDLDQLGRVIRRFMVGELLAALPPRPSPARRE